MMTSNSTSGQTTILPASLDRNIDGAAQDVQSPSPPPPGRFLPR
jgi:hypothetical protein